MTDLVFIVKHAKSCDLIADIDEVCFRVPFFYAQKHNETAPDLAYDFAFNCNGSLRGTLYYRTHRFCSSLRVIGSCDIHR